MGFLRQCMQDGLDISDFNALEISQDCVELSRECVLRGISIKNINPVLNDGQRYEVLSMIGRCVREGLDTSFIGDSYLSLEQMWEIYYILSKDLGISKVSKDMGAEEIRSIRLGLERGYDVYCKGIGCQRMIAIGVGLGHNLNLSKIVNVMSEDDVKNLWDSLEMSPKRY
jgi:hypothetical protein